MVFAPAATIHPAGTSASRPPHTVSGTHGRPSPRVRGPSALQAPLLMCGALGWQAVWSMEMAYASPLLLALGLSKAATAAVLLAGPLAGLVVQPSIGYLSDSCTHSWGRRRPWLVTACLVASFGMLGLGFARPIAALCGSVTTVSVPAPKPAQVLAALGVFAVDFGVNAVMALDRALCVDMLPASEQASGANWAARLAGLGDVLGLQASHMALPETAFFRAILSLLGLPEGSNNVPGLSSLERQMACLCLLSSSALLLTHAVAAYVAVEVPLPKPAHVPVREPLPDLPLPSMVVYWAQRAWESLQLAAYNAATGVADLVADLVRTVRRLPRAYQLIFATQFASWIGWFPLLFYSTLWVANIWRLAHTPITSTSSGMATRSVVHNVALFIRSGSADAGNNGEGDAEAARYGAKALFYRAVISLSVSICAPIFVRATVKPLHSSITTSNDDDEPTECEPPSDTSSWRTRWAPTWYWLKRRLHILEPIDLWLFSIVFLVIVLLSTAYPESHVAPRGATVLMAATGMPWAVVGWIPFTLIGTLVGNDRAQEAYEQQLTVEQARNEPSGSVPKPTEGQPKPATDGTNLSTATDAFEDPLSETESEWDDGLRAPFAGSSSREVYYPLPRPSDDSSAHPDPELPSISINDEPLHHKAGTILGLLNIAIVVPQFLSSAVSSLLFSIADHGAPSQNQSPLEQAAHDARAIGLTLRIGAVCMIVATYTAHRLATQCRIDLRPIE